MRLGWFATVVLVACAGERFDRADLQPALNSITSESMLAIRYAVDSLIARCDLPGSS